MLPATTQCMLAPYEHHAMVSQQWHVVDVRSSANSCKDAMVAQFAWQGDTTNSPGACDAALAGLN